MIATANAAHMMFCVADLPPGSWFTIELDAPAYLVYLGEHGIVDVRTHDRNETFPSSRLRSVLVRKAVTLTSRGGSASTLVIVPLSSLERRVSRRRNSHFVAAGSSHFPLSVDVDPLTAKLLADCLLNAAYCITQNTDSHQLDRAGKLLHGLLMESLTHQEKVPDQQACIPWYISMVESFIAEHASDTVTLKDLAANAGVSVRTLHEGFRRYRGYSPMRYLREHRMVALRTELQNPRALTTVTETALKWGFSHLGRFSTYYAQRFGELPSETLRSARASQESVAAFRSAPA